MKSTAAVSGQVVQIWVHERRGEARARGGGLTSLQATGRAEHSLPPLTRNVGQVVGRQVVANLPEEREDDQAAEQRAGATGSKQGVG